MGWPKSVQYTIIHVDYIPILAHFFFVSWRVRFSEAVLRLCAVNALLRRFAVPCIVSLQCISSGDEMGDLDSFVAKLGNVKRAHDGVDAYTGCLTMWQNEH